MTKLNRVLKGKPLKVSCFFLLIVSLTEIWSKTQIDMLVAYTTQAKSKYADIETRIENSRVTTNEVFSSSKIAANLNMVHVFELEGYHQARSIDGDFHLMTNIRILELERLRDEYSADVICFIVDHPTGSGGIATGNPQPLGKVGYHMILRADALGQMLMAHELGHLLGADHNIEFFGGDISLTLNGTVAWRGDIGGESSRTVMAYGSSFSKIPHFSSPNSIVDKVQIGDSQENNVAAINTWLPQVAGLRGAAPTVEAKILSRTPASNGFDYRFGADLVNGGKVTRVRMKVQQSTDNKNWVSTFNKNLYTRPFEIKANVTHPHFRVIVDIYEGATRKGRDIEKGTLDPVKLISDVHPQSPPVPYERLFFTSEIWSYEHKTMFNPEKLEVYVNDVLVNTSENFNSISGFHARSTWVESALPGTYHVKSIWTHDETEYVNETTVVVPGVRDVKVDMSSPSLGETFAVGSDIPLTANLHIPGGKFSHLEWMANGSLIHTIDTPSEGINSWIWENVAEGNYQITLRVFNGNLYEEVSSFISVTDIAMPEVQLVHPNDGMVVKTGQPLAIAAVANQVQGAIVSLDLIINGEVVTSSEKSSPLFMYTPLSDGLYTAQARVTVSLPNDRDDVIVSNVSEVVTFQAGTENFNACPVALFGPDIQAEVGSVLHLHPGNSFDPKGGHLGFRYEQVLGDPIPWFQPDNSALEIELTILGSFEFELRVMDMDGCVDKDTIVIDATVPNEALQFDGEEDVVHIPHHNDLNLGEGDFTLEVWVRPDANQETYAMFMSNRQGNGLNGFLFGMDRGRPYMQLNGWNAVHSNFNINDGQWHHVVVVREGATLRYIVDGAIRRVVTENWIDDRNINSLGHDLFLGLG